MSAHPLLRLQLAMVAGNEPDSSFIEIRPRDPSTGHVTKRAFVPVRQLGRAVQHIWAVREHLDVWVGCAPRTRAGFGGLNAIRSAWAIWADADDEQASERLASFRPAPSLIVRSGGEGRRQAWWALREPSDRQEVDRANRRLARHLGSDRAVCHAAATMRSLATINHKYSRRVVVERLTLDSFSARAVVARLPDDDRYQVRLASERQVDFRPTQTGSTSGLVRAVADAREGTRNQMLYWSTRRARAEGTLDDVRDELHQAAVAAGLGEREVAATLRSAAK